MKKSQTLRDITEPFNTILDHVKPAYSLEIDYEEYSKSLDEFETVELTEAAVYLRKRNTTEQLQEFQQELKHVPEALRKLEAQVAIARALPEGFRLSEDSREDDPDNVKRWTRSEGLAF